MKGGANPAFLLLDFKIRRSGFRRPLTLLARELIWPAPLRLAQAIKNPVRALVLASVATVCLTAVWTFRLALLTVAGLCGCLDREAA